MHHPSIKKSVPYLPNLTNIRERGYFQNSICSSKAQKPVTLLLQKFNDRRFENILFSAFKVMEAFKFYNSKNRHLEF
jgi:hypothetical protein